MKKYILGLVMLLLSLSCFSQEIIEYKGDTVVAISPKNLETINSIIVNYEYTLEELSLYKQSSAVDSALLVSKDSIIQNMDLILRKKEDYYLDLNNSLNLALEREKRKHRITKGLLGGAGAVAIIVSVILLAK